MTESKLPAATFFFLVYNEEENIGPLLDEAEEVAQEIAEEYELLPVVYEGSTDRTLEIVNERHARDPRIRAVIQPLAEKGMGNAIRWGFQSARTDHIFYADGDRQFRLHDFKRFLPYLGEPCVVAGYRIDRQDPRMRLVSSWVYNRIVRFLFRPGHRDVDCAFRYAHRKVIESIKLTCATGLGTTELLVRARRAGFPVHSVGVPHYPRPAGEPVFEVKHPLNIINLPKPKVVLDLLREMRELRADLKRG